MDKRVQWSDIPEKPTYPKQVAKTEIQQEKVTEGWGAQDTIQSGTTINSWLIDLQKKIEAQQTQTDFVCSEKEMQYLAALCSSAVVQTQKQKDETNFFRQLAQSNASFAMFVHIWMLRYFNRIQYYQDLRDYIDWQKGLYGTVLPVHLRRPMIKIKWSLPKESHLPHPPPQKKTASKGLLSKKIRVITGEKASEKKKVKKSAAQQDQKEHKRKKKSHDESACNEE